MSTERAVMHGLRSAAGAVTSAAVIMVAVFGVFGTLSMQDFKQLGVGLAVAVALDATVIRVLLLPAVMILLGERNWPRSLRRAVPVAEAPSAAGTLVPAQGEYVAQHAPFSRLGRFGQPEAEDRPAVGMVGGRHGAPVRFGDLGDDSQP
jgi:RND superfamily putative drug exporter